MLTLSPLGLLLFPDNSSTIPMNPLPSFKVIGKDDSLLDSIHALSFDVWISGSNEIFVSNSSVLYFEALVKDSLERGLVISRMKYLLLFGVRIGKGTLLPRFWPLPGHT